MKVKLERNSLAKIIDPVIICGVSLIVGMFFIAFPMKLFGGISSTITFLMIILSLLVSFIVLSLYYRAYPKVVIINESSIMLKYFRSTIKISLAEVQDIQITKTVYTYYAVIKFDKRIIKLNSTQYTNLDELHKLNEERNILDEYWKDS